MGGVVVGRVGARRRDGHLRDFRERVVVVVLVVVLLLLLLLLLLFLLLLLLNRFGQVFLGIQVCRIEAQRIFIGIDGFFHIL